MSFLQCPPLRQYISLTDAVALGISTRFCNVSIIIIHKVLISHRACCCCSSKCKMTKDAQFRVYAMLLSSSLLRLFFGKSVIASVELFHSQIQIGCFQNYPIVPKSSSAILDGPRNISELSWPTSIPSECSYISYINVDIASTDRFHRDPIHLHSKTERLWSLRKQVMCFHKSSKRPSFSWRPGMLHIFENYGKTLFFTSLDPEKSINVHYKGNVVIRKCECLILLPQNHW